MADKKNLCAQIDTALHMRVRQEQERSGRTLSEFVEQLITDYYKMKEGTKMTGDMRTMAIQLPEELFERLKAYLKRNNLKQKQFIIGLIIEGNNLCHCRLCLGQCTGLIKDDGIRFRHSFQILASLYGNVIGTCFPDCREHGQWHRKFQCTGEVHH